MACPGGGVLQYVSDIAATRLPPQGIFGKIGFTLGFPAQKEFQGLLYVEPRAAKNERVIRASVRCRGSDRVMSNFFFFDSSQEALDWLYENGDKAHADAIAFDNARRYLCGK